MLVLVVASSNACSLALSHAIRSATRSRRSYRGYNILRYDKRSLVLFRIRLITIAVVRELSDTLVASSHQRQDLSSNRRAIIGGQDVHEYYRVERETSRRKGRTRLFGFVFDEVIIVSRSQHCARDTLFFGSSIQSIYFVGNSCIS